MDRHSKNIYMKRYLNNWVTIAVWQIPKKLQNDVLIKVGKKYPRKMRSGKQYYSEQIIERIPQKFHYTTEEISKPVITYIKLPKDMFPLTIYNFLI